MLRRSVANARLDLRAAMLLGLVTSTFSTLAASMGAGRIGRDAAIDWMVVGSIALRDAGLQVEPELSAIAAGVLIHQFADFAWAVVFFGVLGRWTARLGPARILALVLPWSVVTSALEWLVIAPLLLGWPLFTLEQPYWVGLLVHLLSGALYPLFPAIRDALAGHVAPRRKRFAALWGMGALIVLAVLSAGAFAASRGRELPHLGGAERVAWDRDYMRRMAEHHRQGVEMAKAAVMNARDERLRAAARLMEASQAAEVVVFERWWRSWFRGEAVAPLKPDEHAAMPGMLSDLQVAELKRTTGADFDLMFVDRMTLHHEGAIAMADEAMRRAADPRLRLMAHAIRHQQRGEIALMRDVRGVRAVAAAVRNTVAPAPPPSAHGVRP